MDDRLEKALDFSNLMITLNNQRNIIHEKFLENCVHYVNGGKFNVNRDIINFCHTLIQNGQKKKKKLQEIFAIKKLYIYTHTFIDFYIYMSSPIYCDPRKVPLETPCRDCPRMSFMQKGFHQRNEEEIPTQGTIQWCSVLFRANSFCSLLFPSPPGLNTSQQIQLIYSQLGLTS